MNASTALRYLLAVTALLVAPLARGADEAMPLTIAVARGPVSLLLVVAESMSLFSQEGVAVRRLTCSSGQECFGHLREGRADLATAADVVVSLGTLDGVDAGIVATISASSRQIRLVARRSAGIAHPSDLRRRRLATVRGSSAHYFLHNWLLFHGIHPDEVTIMGAAAPSLGTMLLRHDVDAIAVWEPHATAVSRELAGDAATLPAPLVYTQHFTLVASGAALQAREAAVLKLLRALLRAQRSVEADPSQAAALLAASLGVTLQDAVSFMREHDYRLRLDQSLMTNLGSQGRWAVREGLIAAGARADRPQQAVRPHLLLQLDPTAVSLPR